MINNAFQFSLAPCRYSSAKGSGVYFLATPYGTKDKKEASRAHLLGISPLFLLFDSCLSLINQFNSMHCNILVTLAFALGTVASPCKPSTSGKPWENTSSQGESAR
jgi:hypothetical protein